MNRLTSVYKSTVVHVRFIYRRSWKLHRLRHLLISSPATWEPLPPTSSPNHPLYPPTPPSYTLCYDEDAKRLVVRELPRLPSNAVEVLKLPIRRGEEIVPVYLRQPDATATATILDSHGNAADLGRMFHFYELLCKSDGVLSSELDHLFSFSRTQVLVIKLISFLEFPCELDVSCCRS